MQFANSSDNFSIHVSHNIFVTFRVIFSLASDRSSPFSFFVGSFIHKIATVILSSFTNEVKYHRYFYSFLFLQKIYQVLNAIFSVLDHVFYAQMNCTIVKRALRFFLARSVSCNLTYC